MFIKDVRTKDYKNPRKRLIGWSCERKYIQMYGQTVHALSWGFEWSWSHPKGNEIK